MYLIAGAARRCVLLFLGCPSLAGVSHFLFLIVLSLLQEMFGDPSLEMPLHHELQILCTIYGIRTVRYAEIAGYF